jgi:hypothetical protein
VNFFEEKTKHGEEKNYKKKDTNIQTNVKAGVLICQQPEQLQKSEASSRDLSSVSNHLVATKPIKKENRFFLQISTKKNPKKFCFKTFASFSKMLGFLLLQ